jgi:RNA polymerase sigma-70 factor (ECF subfamily)
MNATAQPLSSFTAIEHGPVSHIQRENAAQAKSPIVFSNLFHLYSRKIYRTVFLITRNHEDAEDALQNAFLHAYLALDSFEGRATFYSWLTRIAINCALMILRKRRCRPEATFDPCSDSGEDLPPFEVKDPGLNPEEAYDLREQRMRIVRAIGRLNPPLRDALQMHLRRGASLKEIAQSLHISEGAVKSRLHRARARLATTHDLDLSFLRGESPVGGKRRGGGIS